MSRLFVWKGGVGQLISHLRATAEENHHFPRRLKVLSKRDAFSRDSGVLLYAFVEQCPEIDEVRKSLDLMLIHEEVINGSMRPSVVVDNTK